jgi:hypothetical protein
MTMKRTSILVVVGACGGSRAGSDTAKPPAPACVSYEASKAEEKAVADRNEANFRRALGEQGLTEPDFPADYFEARDDQGQEWQVVDAAGAKTLLAPVSYLSCGVSNPWRLAMDGSGGVSALMVTPRETKGTTVAICGCQVDIPITCGGAAPQPVRWRWAMATTAAWKGPLNVVVDHESFSTTFAGRGDGKPCPEPTAPP